MVSQKIKATASNKGFTLVELIVVITILAILGTIGFISLQGYSAQSRDSKRSSDIATISKTMTTKLTTGLPLTSMVTNSPDQTMTGVALFAGTGVTELGTSYDAGTPNFTALGMNADSFKDANGIDDYKMGILNKAAGYYQLASKNESVNPVTAMVTGNFVSRSLTTVIAATGGINVSTNSFTIPSSDIGKLRVGDFVTVTAAGLNESGSGRTILSISPEGTTVKIDYDLTGIPTGTGALVLLAEAGGLISTAGGEAVTDAITNGGANLPY